MGRLEPVEGAEILILYVVDAFWGLENNRAHRDDGSRIVYWDFGSIAEKSMLLRVSKACK